MYQSNIRFHREISSHNDITQKENSECNRETGCTIDRECLKRLLVVVDPYAENVLPPLFNLVHFRQVTKAVLTW